MNGWHGKGNGKYFLEEKIIKVSTKQSCSKFNSYKKLCYSYLELSCGTYCLGMLQMTEFCTDLKDPGDRNPNGTIEHKRYCLWLGNSIGQTHLGGWWNIPGKHHDVFSLGLYDCLVHT